MYKFGGELKNLACLFALFHPALSFLTYRHMNTDINEVLCKHQVAVIQDCQIKFLKMVSVIGTAAVLVSTALA